MADERGHFSGIGPQQIHTKANGLCQRIAAQNGSCNFRTNCPPQPATDGLDREAHHILCVSSSDKYLILTEYDKDPDHRDAITAVYKATEWCINQPENLIHLPMKSAYRDREHGKRARALDLPCHDIDHNITGGYTDEVTMEVHKRIWQKIDKIKDKKKKVHAAAEAAKVDLEKISKYFEAELKRRGKRPDPPGKAGTIEAHYHKKPKPKEWWLPFSMAEDSVAKARTLSSLGKSGRWQDGIPADVRETNEKIRKRHGKPVSVD